jgi:NAD(P)H-dependent FMN reductase
MQSAVDQPIRAAIILGSTRPGRRSEAVARWVVDQTADRPDIEVEVIDLADIDLPMLDEAIPAIAGQYEHPHTRAWAEKIGSFDAFIFVTPEYNHSIPAVLKNAIDHLYAEWNNKAAGFVSYGVDAAGARAVEHLRLILAEVEVAGVRNHVALALTDDFEGWTTLVPRPHHGPKLAGMLDQLVSWGSALRTVRAAAVAAS